MVDKNEYIKSTRMANLRLYKFRFPQSLSSWQGEEIEYSQTAAELLSQVEFSSKHSLILCGLSSKDDLLQIVNFYQKKKTVLQDNPHTIILVDFQEGGKLLEAALRLSFTKIISGSKYLDAEIELLNSLVTELNEQSGKHTSHQTYEDLFSSTDKLVVRSNTKRRLYPVEEITPLMTHKSEDEVMRENPVVSFKLYEGENIIESSFSDYFDREVYLTTSTLPESNHLILEFKSLYLGEKKGLRLKTQVINIEENEGEFQLTLKVESHLKEFEAMLKVYQKREKSISHFMKKVKGY